MPDNYAEGHPLRKDFPLRGRFSRAEQTRRALSFDLEDYYSPRSSRCCNEKGWDRAQERARQQDSGADGSGATFPDVDATIRGTRGTRHRRRRQE